MVRKKRYKKWETVDPYHAFDVLGYFPKKDIKYEVKRNVKHKKKR